MNRITFKKGKVRSGLMRLAPTYRVNRDGKEIAIIQASGDGNWYWYGDGQNTFAQRAPLEEVKAAVKKYFGMKPL